MNFHPALRHAAGQQTVAGEGTGALDIRAIHIEDVLWLAREIGEFRDAGLHTIGHLILSHAGLDVRVSDLVVEAAVEGIDVVDDSLFHGSAQALRVAQVKDRIALRAELDPLVFGRDKAASPVIVVEQLATGILAVTGKHDHEAGQVVVGGAESVGRPRTHAGPTGQLVAGEEKGHTGRVVDRLGVHRPDEGDPVRNRTGMGNDIPEHHPRGGSRAGSPSGGRARETTSGWKSSCSDAPPHAPKRESPRRHGWRGGACDRKDRPWLGPPVCMR